MNDVRPLGFLLARSVVNGVKRAVTSPKRLIALVAFGLYYYQILIGRLGGASRPATLPPGAPQIAMPSPQILDACVFGLVGAMSLLLMTSVLGYRGGFKAADVDVLFPTPVSPKVVLLFRIARDTLATLLLPLLIAVLGFRGMSPTMGTLFRNFPKQGGDFVRAFFLAYLLVSLVWVCVGYAASLFVNRSDLRSDRNRKRINLGIALFMLSLAAYVAARLRADMSLDTLLSVAQAPFVRIMLAPVTLATWAVIGTYQGNAAFALGGLVGLVAIVAAALRIALTQVGWMYDQAAVRGFDGGQNVRSLQRKGDLMGVQAERARQGKLKHGRVARRIAGWRVRGPMALMWKEAILQARGSLSSVVALGAVFLAAVAMLMWASSGKGNAQESGGWLLLTMQAMMVYTLCIASSQSGFIEFLRRVDLQKPLPFTPGVTVFWEVVAKALAPTTLAFLAGVVGVAFAPQAWSHALCGAILAFPFAVMLTAVVLLVIVLFPDIEDPTQRMFRGLMMLLGFVIVVVPGAALMMGGVLGLHLSPLTLALPLAALDLGIAVGLSALAGSLYAGYNPSE